MSAYPNQKPVHLEHDKSRTSSPDDPGSLTLTIDAGAFTVTHVKGQGTVDNPPQTGSGQFTGIKLEEVDDKDDDAWKFELSVTESAATSEPSNKTDEFKKSEAKLKLIYRNDKCRCYHGDGQQQGLTTSKENPWKGSWVWKKPSTPPK